MLLSIIFESIEMEECSVAAAIRVKCEPGCVNFKKALDACAARIDAVKAKHPDASCELQYFDFQACVDKCVCILLDFHAIDHQKQNNKLIKLFFHVFTILQHRSLLSCSQN